MQKLIKTYTVYRILRRDGSCFYRAFMYRIMEFIMINGPNHQESKTISEALKKGQDVMLRNGFEKLVIEDFCMITIKTLDSVSAGYHTSETL